MQRRSCGVPSLTARARWAPAAAPQAHATSAKWSSFGFSRRVAPKVGRCYKICPPVVFPTGHDPYYDSPYYIHEQELHGGPYGQVREAAPGCPARGGLGRRRSVSRS